MKWVEWLSSFWPLATCNRPKSILVEEFTMAEECILATYFLCLGLLGIIGDSDVADRTTTAPDAERTPTTPNRAPRIG
jgi:hypothetical protein